MAYSDGDLRAGMEQRGVDLVAKVPPVTNAGRYPKTDFYIDLDAGEVTCPAGEVTADARPSRDHKGRPGLLFRFEAAECATCPLRSHCTAAPGGRTVFVGLHHQRLQAARAAQHDPEIRPCCATDPRWNARSTISRTWACAKPATGADGKPNIKASWPPRWPTSAASTSSPPSANPPHSPRPLERPARPSPPPQHRR